jgi:hypothetical protein
MRIIKPQILILYLLHVKFLLCQVVIYENYYKIQAICEANSILEKQNEDYLISGTTYNDLNQDWSYCILNISSDGDSMETKIWGGVNTDVLRKTILVEDSFYITAGYTYSETLGNDDMVWMKLDNQYNVVWEKKLGGSDYDYALDCVNYNDSTFIISGGYNDKMCLVKSDIKGNILWQNTYSNSMYTNYAKSVDITPDNGIIAAGLKYYADVTTDVYIIKTDSAGNEIWNKTYGLDYWDGANSVQSLNNGYYLIAGQMDYEYMPVHVQGLVLELDDSGNQYIEKGLGGDYDDVFYKGILLSDGNFLFAGTNGIDGWIVKTDNYGDIIYEATFDNDGYEYFTDVIECTDHSIVAAGVWIDYDNLNERKICVIKMDSLITRTNEQAIELVPELLIFPNPSVSKINIIINLPDDDNGFQLKIYDVYGKLVFLRNLNSRQLNYSIPDLAFTEGVYIAYLLNDQINYSIFEKFIIE